MDAEIPTEKLALQIWWAMTWRIIPFALLGGMVVGLIIGLIAGIMKADPSSIEAPATLAGLLLGLFISVRVIMRLMTKGFGEYRLAVVRK